MRSHIDEIADLLFGLVRYMRTVHDWSRWNYALVYIFARKTDSGIAAIELGERLRRHIFSYQLHFGRGKRNGRIVGSRIKTFVKSVLPHFYISS